MILRRTMLVALIIYFLTPYSIKNVTVHCQCGCQEFICYCCGNAENFGDLTSFSDCKCNMIDEFYAQPEGAIAYSFKMNSILDQIDSMVGRNDGSACPGYKEPPMRPPPRV